MVQDVVHHRLAVTIVAGIDGVFLALDIALDLESGLLEREFFKLFEADSEALKQAFEDMQQQIRDHTERIRKALAHKDGLL